MVYFLCLGLGYIIVEVGLIAHFVLALSNPTVSASVLITGMLVFSGLGSLVSERFLDRARSVMPAIFLAIFAILIVYAFTIDHALDWIGTLPYGCASLLCLLLLMPPAFLMGFPMPTAHDHRWPARQGPHVPVGLGHQWLLLGDRLPRPCRSSPPASACRPCLRSAAIAYLVALPAFFALLLPAAGTNAGLARG